MPQSQNKKTAKTKKHKLKPVWKITFILVLAVVVCFSAYYLFLYYNTNAYVDVFIPNVYVNGTEISGMTPKDAYSLLSSQIAEQQERWYLNLKYGEHTYFTLDYAALSIQTDPQELVDILKEAFSFGHNGNAFERNADMQQLRSSPFVAATTQSEMSDSYLVEVLDIIASDMYRAPMNAYLESFNPNDSNPFTIVREQTGQQLNVLNAKEEILRCLRDGVSGDYELIPEILYPEISEREIQQNVSLISTGITPISSSSDENRNNNIRVAFSRFNGKILEPGQKISFNDVVGERSLENGFYPAYEYVSGNLETGIGGGVCQASTTIYLAALLSNMQINTRTSHSDVVSYTTFGQDATVYWGYGRKIDFAFTNSTESTLYITAHVEQLKNKSYQCIVKFYGKALEEGVQYTLDTRTVETIPAPLTTDYVKDVNQVYTTYTDEEYETRKARDGFVNETYLMKWQNENLISETLVSRDTCLARSAQIYVGTQQRPSDN